MIERKLTTAAEREAEKAFKKVDPKTAMGDHEKAQKSFEEIGGVKAERLARKLGEGNEQRQKVDVRRRRALLHLKAKGLKLRMIAKSLTAPRRRSTADLRASKEK